jgi:hypothetical protein
LKPRKEKAALPSISDEQSLKEIANIIPEEKDLEQVASAPVEKPLKEDLPGEAGGITDMLLVIVDFALDLNSLTTLTGDQKNRLKIPLAKIEAQYAPQVISRYAGSSAPFLEVLLVVYSIFKEKRQEYQAKKAQEVTEEPQEKAVEQP